jgi:hypothetical protein
MRQVAKTFLLDVGYFGMKSTHLLGIVDINEVRPGAAVAAGITTADVPINSTTTPRLNVLRPFLGYAVINSVENWFNSNYHSLQVSAQQRLSGNSTLRLAYTLSKTLTDCTSDRANAPQNTYNRAADYARSVRPHPCAHRQLRVRAAVRALVARSGARGTLWLAGVGRIELRDRAAPANHLVNGL